MFLKNLRLKKVCFVYFWLKTQNIVGMCECLDFQEEIMKCNLSVDESNELNTREGSLFVQCIKIIDAGLGEGHLCIPHSSRFTLDRAI